MSDNPLQGIKFFVDPVSAAAREGDPRLERIINNSRGYWFTNQYRKAKVQDRVRRQIARHGDCTAILVLYNIPNRDLGLYSKGGAETPKEYFEFVEEFAKGIGTASPIVILEPDALPACQNLSAPERQGRIHMLKRAIGILSQTKAFIYLDAGNPEFFTDPKKAASYLGKAGIEDCHGFSLNVSNFYATGVCYDYAKKINHHLGESRTGFLVDTGRNGAGHLHKDEWCNPPGRRLGHSPTTETGNEDCHALLWIKPPGESDGEGNGGPRPGVFWKDYALRLCG
jgi:endoglucanase